MIFSEANEPNKKLNLIFVSPWEHWGIIHIWVAIMAVYSFYRASNGYEEQCPVRGKVSWGSFRITRLACIANCFYRLQTAFLLTFHLAYQLCLLSPKNTCESLEKHIVMPHTIPIYSLYIPKYTANCLCWLFHSEIAKLCNGNRGGTSEKIEITQISITITFTRTHTHTCLPYDISFQGGGM